MIDEGTFDRSVSPCDDFYQFVCGGWIARTPVPPDRPSISLYEAMLDQNERLLLKLVEGASASGDQGGGADLARLGRFYSACMAVEQNAPGTKAALEAELSVVAAVKDRPSLARAVARLHLLSGGIGPWWTGRGTLFSLSTDFDLHDSSLVVAQLDQGGVVLSDPTQYLAKDAAGKQQLLAYQEVVAEMLVAAGTDRRQAAIDATSIVRLESTLARASISETDRRDPAKVDNLITRKQLEQQVPSFDWPSYFAALGRPDLESVNLMVPTYYRQLEGLLKAMPAAALQPYLRWHLLVALGPALDGPLAAAHMRLRNMLSGESSLPSRAKLCLTEVDAAMGPSLGQLFAKEAFGEDGRQRATEMSTRILTTFGKVLDQSTWLDDATQRAAREKLDRVTFKLGYPEKPRGFEGLEIGAVHLANRANAAAYNARHWLTRAGTRPDRSEWLMTPHKVDAYYDVARNEMVFPAAIFQPPLFRRSEAIASSYSGVGWVIAHELSHGFDSGGRLFDATGAMRTWWSPDAAKAFADRAACVVRQYRQEEPLPGLHLDGERTLTENIADIGAAKLSFLAYREARRGQPSGARVAGFDEDQQFFVGLAQNACTVSRPEHTRTLLHSDVHSPWKARVNLPLQNLPAFAEAFHCEPGTRMAPKDRCQVW